MIGVTAVFILTLTLIIFLFFFFKRELFYALNYRKKKVFLAGFFVSALATTLSLLFIKNSTFEKISGLAILVSLIGLIDDIFGASEKGLKGHLKALLKGKITTGFLKLVIITAASFVASFIIEKDIFSAVSGGILIASASNLFNLLDLRPGRAVKAFLVSCLPALFFLERDYLAFCLILFLVYTFYLVFDLKEVSMLGDAGSNPLGFFTGIIYLFLAKIIWLKLFFVLLFVGLNLISEKVSFSRVIENNRILRFFDKLGRKK